MGKISVFDDSKGLQAHLFAGAGDEYLTEAQYIRWDDMSAAEIARIDAITDDKDHEKENLVYKLAKIKQAADDKVFVTDAQIDSLFGTCDTTTEPDSEPAPEPTVYTLTTTSDANTDNESVYNTLVAAIFTGDTTTGSATIAIDSNEAASYSIELTGEGIKIDGRYLLTSTGAFNEID